MSMKIKAVLASAALAVGCWIAPAQAQLSATINAMTCNDGAACDADGTVNNMITWLANVTGFSISTTISFTNVPGSPGNSYLDMTFAVLAATGGGGPITLGATAAGFNFPQNGVPSVLTSDLAGNIGGNGTASGQSFINLPGQGTLSPGVQALQTIATLNFVGSTPYTLSQIVNLNLAPGAFATGDFKTEVVPEPAPLALLAIALGALALVRRRKNV